MNNILSVEICDQITALRNSPEHQNAAKDGWCSEGTDDCCLSIFNYKSDDENDTGYLIVSYLEEEPVIVGNHLEGVTLQELMPFVRKECEIARLAYKDDIEYYKKIYSNHSTKKRPMFMTGEKYHIEGDTLIINDGVIAIEGKDFHFYDKEEYDGDYWLEYSSLKEGFEDIKKIIVPNSVTQIGTEAFCEFESLEDISLPNSIKKISPYAFWKCKNLESITIPNSVTNICECAFGGCTNLKSVTIPDSVTYIGGYAFRNCKSLEDISLPNSIKDIEPYMFWSCKSLESITIPDGVTSICDNAFRSCKSLANISIPDSVTGIEYSAFSGCESLTDITIPDSVIYIGYEAFDKCKNLTIACNKGSYAQRFARKEGIPVKYIKDKTKTIERD